jgi:hypothetical protein
MKTTIAIISAFLTAVQAGNVCVAGTYKASKISIKHPIVFAAGAPCDDGRSVTVDSINVDDICDRLPFGVSLCGGDGNVVKISTGPDSGFGCQIGLEIGGTIHEGKSMIPLHMGMIDFI